MNGHAVSGNIFVKTKVNVGYRKLLLHREKVYFSFNNILVIMRVRIMLL